MVLTHFTPSSVHVGIYDLDNFVFTKDSRVFTILSISYLRNVRVIFETKGNTATLLGDLLNVLPRLTFLQCFSRLTVSYTRVQLEERLADSDALHRGKSEVIFSIKQQRSL